MSRYDAMMSYVPLYYRDSDIFKAIMSAEGAEFDLLLQNTADFQNQFFIDTATWGLDLWEKNYGLAYDPNLSIEDRRSRIKGKRRGTGTVGFDLIKSVAEAYANGTVDITFNGSIIVRFVDINGIPSNIDDLKRQVEDICPAHLTVLYRYKYLIISQMEQIRIEDLETMTLNDFENYE